MLENLPEASREQAEAVMERHRDPIRGAVRAMRQSRREVRDALLAEPFDEARLDRALAETRELISLTDGIAPLAYRFDNHQDRAQVVAILSPT